MLIAILPKPGRGTRCPEISILATLPVTALSYAAREVFLSCLLPVCTVKDVRRRKTRPGQAILPWRLTGLQDMSESLSVTHRPRFQTWWNFRHFQWFQLNCAQRLPSLHSGDNGSLWFSAIVRPSVLYSFPRGMHCFYLCFMHSFMVTVTIPPRRGLSLS